jgi:hypothetical protein
MPPPGQAPTWWCRDILAPFAATRALLLFAAWFSHQFSPSWTYPHPEAAARGWAFTPRLWLDLFGRWDSHWYLDLARNGYHPLGPLATTQSNVAFFPLYPSLVAAIHGLLPARLQGGASLVAVAIVLSNAFALAALVLLHRLVRERLADAALAGRAVLYLLLYPAGFVLSCAYPESLFLLLSVATLALADRGRWWLAGSAAGALTLTRPGGVLIVVPLAWAYAEALGWKLGWRRAPPADERGRSQSVRWSAAALLLPPLALAAHALRLRALTGDPLALFHAQAAWGRTLAFPWATLLHPRDFHPVMGPFELSALLGSLLLGLTLLRDRRTAGWGLFALASLVPIVLSGTTLSSIRFLAATFPGFVALSQIGRRAPVDRLVVGGFSAAQALLFFAWARFYWVC